MADTQNAVYGQAYSQNIMQLAQQKYSKLASCVYMKPNVKGKTIYIPEYIDYTLPATEKQFIGYFPCGTFITISNDMVFVLDDSSTVTLTNAKIDLNS